MKLELRLPAATLAPEAWATDQSGPTAVMTAGTSALALRRARSALGTAVASSGSGADLSARHQCAKHGSASTISLKALPNLRLVEPKNAQRMRRRRRSKSV